MVVELLDPAVGVPLVVWKSSWFVPIVVTVCDIWEVTPVVSIGFPSLLLDVIVSGTKTVIDIVDTLEVALSVPLTALTEHMLPSH